jgi:hypothetical protein
MGSCISKKPLLDISELDGQAYASRLEDYQIESFVDDKGVEYKQLVCKKKEKKVRRFCPESCYG